MDTLFVSAKMTKIRTQGENLLLLCHRGCFLLLEPQSFLAVNGLDSVLTSYDIQTSEIGYSEFDAIGIIERSEFANAMSTE